MADTRERKARAGRVGEPSRRLGAWRCQTARRSGYVRSINCDVLCPHTFGDAFWVIVVIDLTRCWVPVVCSNDTRANSGIAEGSMETT